MAVITNWYKTVGTDFESHCKITNTTCNCALCKYCLIAEAYEQSPTKRWGVV